MLRRNATLSRQYRGRKKKTHWLSEESPDCMHDNNNWVNITCCCDNNATILSTPQLCYKQQFYCAEKSRFSYRRYHFEIRWLQICGEKKKNYIRNTHIYSVSLRIGLFISINWALNASMDISIQTSFKLKLFRCCNSQLHISSDKKQNHFERSLCLIRWMILVSWTHISILYIVLFNCLMVKLKAKKKMKFQ